jgi:hypothetical protein
MNRFITGLTRTLIAAPSPFEAAQPRKQQAAIAGPAKILMVGLSFCALLTVPNSVQAAGPQNPNTAREQALRDCSVMERRDTHDPQEGTKTGSRQFVYKGCMADHGQVE